MSSLSDEERFKQVTLSQTLGVLGHEISNVMAIMGLRLAQLDKWQKKNKVTLPEPMSKLFSSLSTDLRRFDCIISGMSQLSAVTDTRTMQDTCLAKIITHALEIEPLEFLMEEIMPELRVKGDAFQLTAMFISLFRYGRGAHRVCGAGSPISVALKADRSDRGLQLTVSFEQVKLTGEQLGQVFKPFVSPPSPTEWGIEASVAYRIAQKNGHSLNIDDEKESLCFVLTFSCV